MPTIHLTPGQAREVLENYTHIRHRTDFHGIPVEIQDALSVLPQPEARLYKRQLDEPEPKHR